MRSSRSPGPASCSGTRSDDLTGRVPRDGGRRQPLRELDRPPRSGPARLRWPHRRGAGSCCAGCWRWLTSAASPLFGAVLTLHLCELELRAGELRESSRLLDEWAESGATDGMETAHARCQFTAGLAAGRPDEMERWAGGRPANQSPATPGTGGTSWRCCGRAGSRALFAHEPERAAGILGRVWEHTLREGVADPGAFPVAPDLVEALVWLGRTAEADAITGRLRDLAERQDHPWALATASRCAAVVRLASGYDERAAAQLADAAASYGELGLGFDRARSLLWLGREARRARKRTAARRALETASAEFDALGSPGWAEQAGAELDLLGATAGRTGGRPDSGRATGGRAGGERAVEQADRQAPVRGDAHGGSPPGPRLRQTRRPFPGTARQPPGVAAVAAQRLARPAARHGLRVFRYTAGRPSLLAPYSIFCRSLIIVPAA